jgi:outer membrane protein OmpA-like peptidoglycan-associated protein
MKKLTIGLFVLLMAALISLPSCSSWNKTQKGAAVGTAAGGAMGAVIGKASGNTALGAIIGAAAGGGAGAIIGHQMDKQAEEIQETVPDAKVVRVGEGIVVEFSSAVLFGFDQSSLTSASKENLNKLVLILDEYAETDIEIQGYTDSKGSHEYNQGLSERRAIAVSNYIVKKNISSNRITIVGYGETLPKYSNETTDGRSQNRRVEFVITANDKMKKDAAKQASN